jgi:hypothetical protein
MGNIRVDKWTEDIDQLALELPRNHRNLFFHLKKRDFYKQIQNLKSNLENHDNYMICTKIASIVASVGDAHTAVIMPIARFIPFEFYWFPDGIYIVASLVEHTDLINSKVTHLNGIPMNEVTRRVACTISCENDSFLKAQLPKYLPAVEVLYGLEIIDEFDAVELTLEMESGQGFEVTIDTYEYNTLNREMVKGADISEDCTPLYRRNKGRNFWSFFIEEQNTVYFKYNRCRDMQDISVERFCYDLMKFINQKDAKRLVIDLRNNLGGNSTLLEPFIRELRQCNQLNREGGIFVIVGRETFSSALLNAYALKNKTKAIFVGEATGGKPNCYGEVQYFDLKNSKLKISYSTEYYKVIKDIKQLSFFPEVKIEVTVKDYIDKRDPCMDHILGI